MTTITEHPKVDPERDAVIARIRKALKARSDRTWSVKGGRGTSWGWITVTAPPARIDQYGGMSDDDRAELSALLGLEVHHQGATIPPQTDYREEYVDRAEGRTPRRHGHPQWD